MLNMRCVPVILHCSVPVNVACLKVYRRQKSDGLYLFTDTTIFPDMFVQHGAYHGETLKLTSAFGLVVSRTISNSWDKVYFLPWASVPAVAKSSYVSRRHDVKQIMQAISLFIHDIFYYKTSQHHL